MPAPWSTRTLQIGALQRELLSPTLVPVDACPVDADAAAFWCHSSGTSGKPKAVMHAHRFADRIEQVSREGLGIRGDDRLFASSKLFFSYPQTNGLWAGLKPVSYTHLDVYKRQSSPRSPATAR